MNFVPHHFLGLKKQTNKTKVNITINVWKKTLKILNSPI